MCALVMVALLAQSVIAMDTNLRPQFETPSIRRFGDEGAAADKSDKDCHWGQARPCVAISKCKRKCVYTNSCDPSSQRVVIENVCSDSGGDYAM